MKCFCLICIGFAATLACQPATAVTGLEGIWKYAKSSCYSGAPYKLGESLERKLAITLIISENHIVEKVKMAYRQKPAYARERLKKADEGIAALSAAPDSPAKQKGLAEAQANKKLIKSDADGVACEQREVLYYQVDGSSILTSRVAKQTTCPTGGGREKRTEVSQFVRGGNTLIFIGSQETKRGSSCPKGDRAITTLVRVN
jgi:hypothetical protein